MEHLFKKSTFFILFMLVFGIFSISNAAAPPSFTDINTEHPYKNAIDYLKSRGIIKGYVTGEYKPEQTINRAEFLAIVIQALGEKPAGVNCFKDVKNQWYAKYICTAKKKGFVSGYKDKTFKPNQNISLAEASKIIAKAFNLHVAQAAQGGAWSRPYLAALQAKKAIPVSIDYFDKKITRAEMAEIIDRILENKTNRPSKTYEALSSEFPVLGSCAELKEKFAAYQYMRPALRYGIFEKAMSRTVMPLMTPRAETAAPEESAGAAVPDYSATNVQVSGVDEADVVKNDAEHIYFLKRNTIRIVRAYPPAGMAELTKVTFADSTFNAQEMYVAGDKLVVVGSSWGEKSRTKIYIFDIADRANVIEERSLEFDGSHVSSRRIGNRVYLVTNEYPRYYSILEKPGVKEEDLVPTYKDSVTGKDEILMPCGDIHFYPRFTEPNYLIVASVSLEAGDNAVSREVFMGMGGTVYSSIENLYVAAQFQEYNEEVRYDIWNPPVVSEKTLIYRFKLNDGNVEYKGQGLVPGHLLNQFSMDENNGAFRVATTKGEVWDSEHPSENNLYILDVEDLKKVLGKIEGIARGEKIYSVRFISNRAYMVTFKKVDPFFVIDVSNPADPKVLGALKIPGFSDYLHPFDENHIIGFGKDTVEPSELEKEGFNNSAFDFAWYQGMKIALFDVTDVANPTLMFNEIIGDRGTDSELLTNHKALLYDKGRNLFAFPITVNKIPEDKKTDSRGDTYGTPVFQGAYVYTLDLEHGFQKKGEITNYDDPEFSRKQGYYLYDNESSVKRIVYIGDYLYTISMGKVKATDRNTMTEAKAVDIEKTPEPEYPPSIDIMPIK